MAAERGNYRAAGAAGVKTVVLGVAAGVGIAQGVGALAGREATAGGAASGVTSSNSYVYQLVDNAGDAVYYGISNNPLVTIGQHARTPPGPFRGMQVISETLPLPQAQALETSLIQQAGAECRLIYNISPS